MEIRILGSVEARGPGGPVPLGGPKPATLLADELGVDPGPVLHRAHQQVLAGAPVPAQLPPGSRRS